MARKIGLGKGLNALLDNNDDADLKITSEEIDEEPAAVKNKAQDISPQASSQASSQATVQLHVEKLLPNPGQPRKNFDETELQELADSIKTYGIIQPVIAANAGDGTYIIIAGERRTRAAKLAGLDEVPVIIRDYTDQNGWKSP